MLPDVQEGCGGRGRDGASDVGRPGGVGAHREACGLPDVQEGMEEEKMARAISVDQEERQPGLLSRAFAPGSGFARAVSLHNLLDVHHLDTLPESVRALPRPFLNQNYWSPTV